jgi:hypothetical protein
MDTNEAKDKGVTYEQQTFSGHFCPGIVAYFPHSALALQFDWHP